MILLKQKCCILLTGVSTVINIPCINVGLALSYVKLLLGKIYVQFEGMPGYQQIVGIPMGTNCAPLIVVLFFILLWGAFYV